MHYRLIHSFNISDIEFTNICTWTYHKEHPDLEQQLEVNKILSHVGLKPRAVIV